MGPIIIFDKSFLQSLSVDESVWLDHYFMANICPIFYVETLADLEKAVHQGRTPEQEVGLIADKFPEHGTPCAYHSTLCIGNLLGYRVPMIGQILVSNGRMVRTNGKSGVVFEQSPESDAFLRWQQREFLEIERQYAQTWRRALSSSNFSQVAKYFRDLGINENSCKNLEDAKAMAHSIVTGRNKHVERMKLTFSILSIPFKYQTEIFVRWHDAGLKPLVEYAPYAAHVLTVEVFFQIALAANLISSERPSNRMDIAYIFYLPFCMIFASSDKLHRKCVPLFLRNDQEFIWGYDFKKGLSQINKYYSNLPESTKEKGVHYFADNPPEEGDFFVAQVWDRHFQGWRERENINLLDRAFDDAALVKEIKKMADAPSLKPHEIDFDTTNPDAITIKRRISKKKGSWYQLPKDLKDS